MEHKLSYDMGAELVAVHNNEQKISCPCYGREEKNGTSFCYWQRRIC